MFGGGVSSLFTAVGGFMLTLFVYDLVVPEMCLVSTPAAIGIN